MKRPYGLSIFLLVISAPTNAMDREDFKGMTCKTVEERRAGRFVTELEIRQLDSSKMFKVTYTPEHPIEVSGESRVILDNVYLTNWTKTKSRSRDLANLDQKVVTLVNLASKNGLLYSWLSESVRPNSGDESVESVVVFEIRDHQTEDMIIKFSATDCNPHDTSVK